MADDLPPHLKPEPKFDGRCLWDVFAGAAAGNADDQLHMAGVVISGGSCGKMEPDLALGIGELFAKMAVLRGRPDARENVVNILLAQAERMRHTQPERAQQALSEAVSYLDELAGEDHDEAAQSLDRLLAAYQAAGSTPEDRDALVARAKVLREWRDRYGVMA